MPGRSPAAPGIAGQEARAGTSSAIGRTGWPDHRFRRACGAPAVRKGRARRLERVDPQPAAPHPPVPPVPPPHPTPGLPGSPGPLPHAYPPPHHVTASSARLPLRHRLFPSAASRFPPLPGGMAVFHDEVEIEDFEYDEETETYSYPCPCGDRFLITRVRGGRAGLGGRTGRCGLWAVQAAGP